jgi:uncharacterized tellurite resistance protein B-like protein
MRSYPVNSPQAAARVLSLLMLADGHLSRPELDQLTRLDAHGRLGVERDEMFKVLNTYCEDRLHATHMNWVDACRVDLPTLRQLLAEIEAPELRQTLLDLCLALVGADTDVAEDELRVLNEAAQAWNLPMPARQCDRESLAA